MDVGKEIEFEAGRNERSKDVVIQFQTENNFIVLDGFGTQKYIGVVGQEPALDDCTCPSFFHNNNEKWESSHPEPFQCKHLMKAKRIKNGQEMEMYYKLEKYDADKESGK